MQGPVGGAPMSWGCKILERLRAEREAEQSDPRCAIRTGLTKDKYGKVRATLANVLSILLLDPDWQSVIAFDEFREGPVLLRSPPQREADRVAHEAGADWQEQDSTRTATWIAQTYGCDPSSKLVEEAVMTAARRKLVHPVRAYLDGLEWDKKPRIDKFFSTYCGSADTPYTSGVARILFLSSVARIRHPGCKVDTVVILEGEQGKLKSSLIEKLFTPWSADTPLPIGEGKDAYQVLRNVWGYELAELASFKGRDAERIKSFASSAKDTYRPSYERRSRSVPRQCVFIGTTNSAHYFVDPTGARRFLPVPVPGIDLTTVQQNRDQLWAEADARFRNSEPWWPEKGLATLAAVETEERYEGDSWEDPLFAWLKRPTKLTAVAGGPQTKDPVLTRETLDPNTGFTLKEIMDYALGLAVKDQGKREQARVTSSLRRAKWDRGPQVRVDGEVDRVRRWAPEATVRKWKAKEEERAAQEAKNGAGDRAGDGVGDRAGDT
jgi:putative DNA primase/helicase